MKLVAIIIGSPVVLFAFVAAVLTARRNWKNPIRTNEQLQAWMKNTGPQKRETIWKI
jgi:hypothetical protein